MSETVVKYINFVGGSIEESALLSSMDTMVIVRHGPVGLGIKSSSGSLSVVFREDVFSTVNIFAEEVVVNLLSVS